MLETIDKIEDQKIQRKCIRKLLQLRDKEAKKENTNQYNLKSVLDQFSKPRPTTLQDLQKEISQIKSQIKKLKSQDQNLEIRIQNLENIQTLIKVLDTLECSQMNREEIFFDLFIKNISKLNI